MFDLGAWPALNPFLAGRGFAFGGFAVLVCRVAILLVRLACRVSGPSCDSVSSCQPLGFLEGDMHWQSWNRVLGLSSRAIFLTTQRLLDVAAIYVCYESKRCAKAPSIRPMVFGLILTTFLWIVTMRAHWSGLRGHRPHGFWVAVVTSCLQIAAMWEMVDKVISGGRPRPKLEGSAQQPLLPLASTPDPSSNPPKGSPGENAMRGVRKLSICNIPQSFISLWFHIGLLVAGSGPLSFTPSSHWRLGFVFVAGFLSLSFGIADFVLYIWVDDIFVRRNKKLVTAHYCAEILSRLPTVALFHFACQAQHGDWPLVLLLSVDMLSPGSVASFFSMLQLRPFKTKQQELGQSGEERKRLEFAPHPHSCSVPTFVLVLKCKERQPRTEKNGIEMLELEALFSFWLLRSTSALLRIARAHKRALLGDRSTSSRVAPRCANLIFSIVAPGHPFQRGKDYG